MRGEIERGAETADCVYNALDVEPRCGACRDHIEAMIDEFRAARPMIAAE